MTQKKKILNKNKEQQLRNKSFFSATKTAIKKSKLAAKIHHADTESLVNAAYQKIDKAVTKRIIKKNKGARMKSSLSQLLAKSLKEKNAIKENQAKLTASENDIVDTTIDNKNKIMEKKNNE